MRTVIGIDPGMSGGIAFISEGKAVAFPTPETLADLVDALKDLLRLENPIVYLEKVGGMPRNGHRQTWNFARNVGQIEGVICALGFAVDYVRPQVWQKALGCLSKGDKNVTKRKAQELFPGLKITHATADALLIAEYARRTYV